MPIILTYDLRETKPDYHTEVKAKMIKDYGYSEEYNAMELPNTTLHHMKVSPNDAVAHLKTVAASVPIPNILESYVCCEYSKILNGGKATLHKNLAAAFTGVMGKKL